MTKLTNIFKAKLAGIFLLILSAYYVNSTMCYHQHVISGETIFHSHFSLSSHSSNPNSSGGHTLEMAKLIAILSNIALEEQSFESHLAEVERPLIATLESVDIDFRATIATPYPSLRAPPFCV